MGKETQNIDVDAVINKNKLLLSQIQFLNDELCKVKKDYETEKKKHEEDLDASRSDLMHMVEESVELKNQIQVLKEDLDDLEDQHLSMVGDKSLRNDNLLLRKDIRTLKTQFENVSAQYEMVRDEYNSTLFEANDLRKQITTMKNELLIKTNELKRIYRELEQNRSDMAMMMREYAEVKNEDQGPANAREVQEENHRLKNDVESLQRHNESLTVLLNELRMEIARISEQRSVIPGLYDDDEKDVNAEGETLESKGVITNLLTPEDIHAALTLCVNSLSVLATSYGQSEAPALVRCVSPVLLVKKQLMMVNDETGILVRREDQHREALMNQDSRIDELEDQVKALQHNNEALQEQLETSNYENHSLQQKVREREREVQTVRRDMMVLQGLTPAAAPPTSNDTGKSVEELERQLDTLRQQYTQRMKEDDEAQAALMQEKESLEEQLNKKSRDIEELHKQVMKLEADLDKQEKLVEVKDTSIAALKTEIEQTRLRLAQVQEEKSQDVSSTAVTVTELKRLLAEKDRQLKEKQDALDDAEDALDDEKDLTTKLKKDNRDLVEARDRLRADVKDLEEDNDELLEQVKKATEQAKQIAIMEAESSSLRERIATLTQETTVLKKKLETASRSVSQTPKPIPVCEEVPGKVLECRERIED